MGQRKISERTKLVAVTMDRALRAAARCMNEAEQEALEYLSEVAASLPAKKRPTIGALHEALDAYRRADLVEAHSASPASRKAPRKRKEQVA